MHRAPRFTAPRRATIVLFLIGLATGGSFFGGWPCAPRSRADTVAANATTSQVSERLPCLARLGADHWHAAGFRGQGVKVAILDSGFRGYRAFLGKGLPTHVTARSFRNDGNLEAKDSRHGILCGE